MNNLIKDLAIVADFGQPTTNTRENWQEWVALDEDIEFFAQLVALECIRIIENENIDKETVIKKIKEKFF